MKKETVKNPRTGDPEFLAGTILAGSAIKYGNDWETAREATIIIGIQFYSLWSSNKLKPMTASQVASLAAGRIVEAVDSKGPSNEGVELRYDGKHWELFVDGKCFHQKNLLKGKCIETVQFKVW